jgi:WD40 repeat protein/mono/diheme cytochrome c family protein
METLGMRSRHPLVNRAVVLFFLASGVICYLPSGRIGADEKPVSFMRDIAPILKESCLACHDAKKRSGKLDMSTFERFAAGGNSDSPFVAGKPEESLLIELITTTGKKRMPPEGKGQRLTQAQVDLVTRWIQQGARLDPDVDSKADLVRELRKRWQPPSLLDHYRFPVSVTALAFTPDGKHIVAGGHHELLIWNIPERRLKKRIRTRSERSYGFVFTPDGMLVVAGARPGQEGDVRVYNPNGPGQDANGTMVLDGVENPQVLVRHLLDTDDSMLCLALSADGKRLAAAGCDRVVRVWDLTGGWNNPKLEQSIENHADWVLSLTFTPDGKHLLSASRDKTAKVWDLQAKESVMTFPDHQQPVYAVAASRDSKLGYSAGEDKQIRIWNAAPEGKQVRALGGHTDSILRLIAHPGQALIASASADKSVRLWNPDSGAAGHVLHGLSDQVYSLAFSPDGGQIAAGSYNGEVIVWNIADGKLVAKLNVSPGLAAAP